MQRRERSGAEPGDTPRRQPGMSDGGAMAVRVGPDCAGVDREAFAAHQPLGHAAT
jgi:hypothetical protein